MTKCVASGSKLLDLSGFDLDKATGSLAFFLIGAINVEVLYFGDFEKRDNQFIIGIVRLLENPKAKLRLVFTKTEKQKEHLESGYFKGHSLCVKVANKKAYEGALHAASEEKKQLKKNEIINLLFKLNHQGTRQAREAFAEILQLIKGL